MQKYGAKFIELFEIISRLRAIDGCPWDRKQTSKTMQPYLIEETRELSEALTADDADHVREELGDVFFILIFLTQLYQEKNRFTITEVLDGISQKMIRRHPHVFDGTVPGTDKELRENWLAIKAREKSRRDAEPARSTAPVADAAGKPGLERPGPSRFLEKASTELIALSQAWAEGRHGDAAAALSAILFNLVDFGGLTGIDCGEALASFRKQQTGDIGNGL